MTMNYVPPAPPMTQPPPSGGSTGVRFALAAAVITAVAALALSIIAVTRMAPAQNASEAGTTRSALDESGQAAAQKAACESWEAAARGMVVARQPFTAATQTDDWSWNDPAVQSALAQAQAGTLAQVEYLRGQLNEKTPVEIAKPIREYIDLNIAIVALDGQHARADLVNATAKQSNVVREQIESICGKS